MLTILMGLCAPLLAADDDDGGPLSNVNVSGAVDIEARYWDVDDTLPDFPDRDDVLDYYEQVLRVNLMADHSRWQLGLQADQVSNFGAHYYLNDEKYYDFVLKGEGVNFPGEMHYANVEKVWGTLKLDGATVQAGDGYVSFGRGLALNIVKNTDIDVDTSVRGAQVSVNKGDWGGTLVSGVTNQQQVYQDNPNKLQIRANRQHMVSGARVDRYGLGPANLGAHAAVYSFSREPDQAWDYGAYGQTPDAVVAGATAELWGVAGMDWFVEGDWYQHFSDDLLGGEPAEPGHALYASTSAYLDKFSILVEAKKYKNTERVNTFAVPEGYEVATGPNLEYERIITEDSSAAVNSNDIYGGRVYVDIVAVPGSITPYVSAAVFRDLELGGLHFNETPETIIHPVVGGDFQGEHLQLLLNTGYRVDIRDGDHGADRMIHGDATFGFPAGPVHGEFIWDAYKFWWGENQNQQEDFLNSTISAAAHTENGWAFILYNDFTNDPLISSKGNLIEDTELLGLADANVYLAGEVQWQPLPATTIKAFYGAYKAGIRCAGGQCRRLPGFDGARVSVTHQF